MQIVRHFDFHHDTLKIDSATECGAQIDLGCRFAERFDQLGEGLMRHRFRTVPDGGAHEGKARRQGRFAFGDCQERRTRRRTRVGIFLVETGEHFGHQSGILDAAPKYTDMIKSAREEKRAAARNEAVRRLQPDDATE